MIAVTNDANLESGFPADDDLFSATADNEGCFALRAMAPPNSLLSLYVFHESGTAFIPDDRFTAGMDIELEPWVTLEGEARRDGQPQIDAEIELSCHRIPGNSPYLLNSSRVRTDPSGHFVFDRVPAGFDGSLRRILNDGSHGFGIGYMSLPNPRNEPDPRNDEVETRFPRRLVLEGRRVTGQIQVPPMNQPFVSAIIHFAHQRFEPQNGFERLDEHEQAKRFEEWFESPAGRASRQATCYTVMRPDQEGRFCVEDVPPGELEILIEIHDLRAKPLQDLWKRIRRVPREVRITHRFEIAAGSEPIDLGLIRPH